MAENIVKNRFYRILSDASNQIWDRISFWNTAEDTQANDGQSIETKVGAINGITSDLTCEDESIAVSAKAVNDSLGTLSFGQDENGNWGYRIAGADSVTPFSGGKIIAVLDRNISTNGNIARGTIFNETSYCTAYNYTESEDDRRMHKKVTFNKSCKVTLCHTLVNSTKYSKVTIKLNDVEIFTDSITNTTYTSSHKQVEFSAKAGDILDIQYDSSNAGLIGGHMVLIV